MAEETGSCGDSGSIVDKQQRYDLAYGTRADGVAITVLEERLS